MRHGARAASSRRTWITVDLAALYNFQGGQDGSVPQSPVIVDAAGNLYGYTTGGTWGTVFELSPPTAPAKAWKFQIPLYLHQPGRRQSRSGVAARLPRQRALRCRVRRFRRVRSIRVRQRLKLTPGSGRKWIDKIFRYRGDYAYITGTDPDGPLSLCRLHYRGSARPLGIHPAPWPAKTATKR